MITTYIVCYCLAQMHNISPHRTSFFNDINKKADLMLKRKYQHSFSISGPRAWYLDLTTPKKVTPHRLFLMKTEKNKLSHQISVHKRERARLVTIKKEIKDSINYVSFNLNTYSIQIINNYINIE